MVMKEPRQLYIIHEIPYVQFLFSVLGAGWIYFSYLKYVVNPEFFMITSILVGVAILMMPRHVIEATEDEISIQRRHWIPFFNKKKHWKYQELIAFRYDHVKPIWIFISWIFPGGIVESSRLVLVIKGKKSKYYPAFGCDEENRDIAKIIQTRINMLNTIK